MNKSNLMDDMYLNIHEDAIFPVMSVAVVYMMHKYLTCHNYTITTPIKKDAVFGLISPKGNVRAELLISGRVVEFGKGVEAYSTKEDVLDFYAKSSGFKGGGVGMARLYNEQKKALVDQSCPEEDKVFDSYDDAYYIMKCYYHDTLCFNLTVPEDIPDGVLLTLESEGIKVELVEGWKILENGKALQNKDYMDIMQTPELATAVHPKMKTQAMNSLGLLRYWQLKDCTLLTLEKRARSAKIKTYLLYNPANDLYKIGKSINPDQRAINIQSMAGNPLKILYVIHENVEHELHKKFATQNHYGEWFTDESGSIRDYFKQHSKLRLVN